MKYYLLGFSLVSMACATSVHADVAYHMEFEQDGRDGVLTVQQDSVKVEDGSSTKLLQFEDGKLFVTEYAAGYELKATVEIDKISARDDGPVSLGWKTTPILLNFAVNEAFSKRSCNAEANAVLEAALEVANVCSGGILMIYCPGAMAAHSAALSSLQRCMVQ